MRLGNVYKAVRSTGVAVFCGRTAVPLWQDDSSTTLIRAIIRDVLLTGMVG